MRSLPVFLLVCLASLCLVLPAYAYVEPGSASIIFQLLMGGLAGISVLVKLYWAKMVEFCQRRTKK